MGTCQSVDKSIYFEGYIVSFYVPVQVLGQPHKEISWKEAPISKLIALFTLLSISAIMTVTIGSIRKHSITILYTKSKNYKLGQPSGTMQWTLCRT